MYSREPCTLYLKREINKCISNIYRLVYLRSNLQIIFMKMSAILYKALFQFPWQLNNKWESQYQNGVFFIQIKKLKFIFCATNNHYLSPLYVKSLFSNCHKYSKQLMSKQLIAGWVRDSIWDLFVRHRMVLRHSKLGCFKYKIFLSYIQKQSIRAKISIQILGMQVLTI